MRYGKLPGLCLILCCLVSGATSSAALPVRVNLAAQITMEPSGRPPRLTARLYFPKETGRKPIVTVTDDNGRFAFNALDDGQYLLELYQGEQLIHQQIVYLPRDQQLNIRLRARSDD
ncbi:MAG TPA: hypothetical protein VF525_17065 [Pyrinomonadaceae bacterium]|jgi:hypothetical protein